MNFWKRYAESFRTAPVWVKIADIALDIGIVLALSLFFWKGCNP